MKEERSAASAAPKRYAAFISYRHLSPDMEVARALHKLLEHNQVRPDRHTPRNIRPVFLDTGELPTLEDLDAGIYQALENSDCLFVVCSPNLPLSKWCLREIEYFKKLHGGRLSRVYTILADGDPAEAFPQILREEVRELPDGTTETAEVEPLFADVRADTLRGSIRKLKKTEYLRLAAAYYRCSYDGLYKRHRRWLWRVAGCAAALALLVAAGFGVYSWYSRMRYDSAKAATYAAYAEDRTRAGDEPLAIALAAEGWDAAVSSGSPRLMTALRSAAVQYDYRTRALPAAPALSVRYDSGPNSVFYLSEDGGAAITHSENILQISDVHSGTVQQRLPMDSAFLLGERASRYVVIRAEEDADGVLWDTASLWSIAENRPVSSYAFRRSERSTPVYAVETAVETDAVILILDRQEPVAYMDADGNPLTREEAARRMIVTAEPVEAPDAPFRLVLGGTKYEKGRKVNEGTRVENSEGETMLTLETAHGVTAFAPDWKAFACAENGHVRIYDTETWTLAAEFPQEDGLLLKMHLLRDVPYIVLHTRDAENRDIATLVDWRSGETLLEAEGYVYDSGTDNAFYCLEDDRWTRYTYRMTGTETFSVIAQNGSRSLAAGSLSVRMLDAETGEILLDLPGASRRNVKAADDLSRILVRTGGKIACLDGAGSLLWVREEELATLFALAPDGSAAAWLDEDGIHAADGADGSDLFTVPADTPGFDVYADELAVCREGACIAGANGAVWFPAGGGSRDLGGYDGVTLAADGLLFLESRSAYVYDFAVWDPKTGKEIFRPSENTGVWAYSAETGTLARRIETSGNHGTWDLELLRRKGGTFESEDRLTLTDLSVTDLRMDSAGEYLTVTAGGTTRVYALRDRSLILSVEDCPLLYEGGAFRALEIRGTEQYSVPVLEGEELKAFAMEMITDSSGVRTLTPEEQARYSFSR